MAVNVAAQTPDAGSMLSLYRTLLTLRRAEPALSVGTYVPVSATERVLAYERRQGETRLLIALNFSGDKQPLDRSGEGEVLLSTHLDTGPGQPAPRTLRANEGVAIRLPASAAG
jgi:alpha-glucosidase